MPPLLTLPRGKTLDNVSWSPPFPPCFCLTLIRPSGRCEALKSECVRTYALGGFEEAKTIIAAYVHEYNDDRLHSALNALTPADSLKGEETIRGHLERRKDALEKARKDRRQRQALLRQETRSA